MKFPLTLSKSGAEYVKAYLAKVLKPEFAEVLKDNFSAWESDILNGPAGDRAFGAKNPPAFEVRGHYTMTGRPHLIELADDDFEWSN